MRTAPWMLILILTAMLASCVHSEKNRTDRLKKARRNSDVPTEEILSSAALGAGDVFIIHVFREEDLSGEYRADPDGKIQFPLIGEVVVEDKNASQLAEEIQTRLEKDFLKNPYVSVFVKEFNSKKIFIFGEVKKPGTFPSEDGMNIIQAITLAGGFTERAAKNSVSVTRKLNGKEKRFEVRVEDITRGLQTNIPLLSGDIVFVPETFF